MARVEGEAATGPYHAPSGDFAPGPERPDRRAAWLSSVLAPLARPTFAGPSPLNLVDANLRGTGQSLLVDVCSTLLTGRPAARMSHSKDEEETRKQVTGLALEATRLVQMLEG